MVGNGNSINADITEDTIKPDQNDAFFALLIQYGSCFGLFVIAGKTQYTYIVEKYIIHLHSLRNKAEKLVIGKLFYLF